ncbi:MAG: NAD(P)/FAD-dependent oxidoreductase [Solirubrobacteraceae bacterium]
MEIVVIGGGVIGLSAAEALARRGASVTVLDAERFGAGASHGNAGWISPGLANPVPAPGVMTQALRWMPNPRSPLLVHPSVRKEFLRWSWAFWRSTRPRRYGAGMAALAALGARALEDYDRLVDLGVTMEMHHEGLLFVGRTDAAVDAETTVLEEAQALGYPGRIRRMDRDETLDHEPALDPRIAGSVYAVDERHVRPESVCAGLVAHLSAGRADLREGVAVHSLVRTGGRWAVRTTADEELRADRVVVATGWEADELLRPLGFDLPLEGGKGYSVTVPRPAVRPRGTLYLLEDRVAVSAFDGGLRLAGTMEIGTRDPQVNPGRMSAVEAAGRRALVAWSDENAQRWAGFRPMLPDGLPALGPVPGLPGLHVATGHAMLGVTLAPTTAEILAPAVLEDRPTSELAPFSVARFRSRRPLGDLRPAVARAA